MSRKISVIGAGNVGATCANVLATRNVSAEIILLDNQKGLAEGKAIDIMQTAPLVGINSRIKGVTDDYESTSNSDVVIITAGVTRKPGMSREDLVGVNGRIVKSVVTNVLKYSPDTILIIVSNPMDTMCYLANKISGLPRHKVLGLGGALDSSRLKYYLNLALNVNVNDIQATVIGGHGDTTMVPVISLATCKGAPVTSLLPKEKLDEIVEATKVGGATLLQIIGTSAWYAPGAAAAILAESIVNDQKRILACGVMLEGEYGEQDLVIGVPVIIGQYGWERIVDFPLTDAEKEAFNASAKAIKKVNHVLEDIGIL
ncbi:MAG: malate dehydrogenase [Tannerella sp.]|jgi:malate dehydrogenase|nr:malate dehydrogenase [Tannerella sp.]